MLVALVDDAAMFPPGNAAVAEAAAAHRDHRRSWFGPLVGPLVVRDQTLARQLSVLAAAGLPFKVTAGLPHARPTPGPDPDRPRQHGFLPLLAAVDALAAGASEDEAAALLGGRERTVIEDVRSWGDARAVRVRQRFRSFGCCGVTDPVVALGLLRESA